MRHGYVRDRHGRFTRFDARRDVPSGGWGTMPTSINPWGAIAGIFIDATSAYHGFVRDIFRRIRTFDAPDAGTGLFQGTYALAINPQGVVTGYYKDANNVSHGFVRDIFGRIRTFDDPDACSSGPSCSNRGTFPVSINPAGVIVGSYTDAGYVSHGFLLTP